MVLYESPVRFWFASLAGFLVSSIADRIRQIGTNTKLKRKLILIGAFALVIGGAMAVAQPSPSVPPAGVNALPSKGVNPIELIGSIADAVDQQVNQLLSNTALRNIGYTLTAFGLFIGMLWAGLKTMIGGRGLGELIGEWTPLFVAFGVIYALLDANGGGQIIETMNMIGSVVSGMDVSSAKAILPSVAGNIFKSVNAIVEMPMSTTSNATLTGLLDGSALYIGLFSVGAFLVKIVVALMIVVAGCIYMAIAILAMVGVALAMGLAPIMVPFLIFSPLSWLFDSWLRFLLGACMMKVVGAFMLKLTDGLLTSMVHLAGEAKKDSMGSGIEQITTDIVLYGFLLLLAVLAALLMAQVPTIATGLLQGSAGGAGFRGIAGATNTMGARAGSGAMSGAARGSYNQSLGRLVARETGKRDQAKGLPTSAGKFENRAQHRSYLASYTKANKAAKEEEKNQKVKPNTHPNRQRN